MMYYSLSQMLSQPLYLVYYTTTHTHTHTSIHISISVHTTYMNVGLVVSPLITPTPTHAHSYPPSEMSSQKVTHNQREDYLPSYLFTGDMAAMSASPSADLSPLAAMVAREREVAVVVSPPQPKVEQGRRRQSWLTTPLEGSARPSIRIATVAEGKIHSSANEKSGIKVGSSPGWLTQGFGANVAWTKPETGENGEERINFDERMMTLNSAVGRMRSSFRDMNAVAPSNF